MSLHEFLQDTQKFNSLMEKIDNEMRTNNVPIQGRPLEGIAMISKKFRCSIIVGGPDGEQINSWFRRRYGDRLKVNWDIGSTVVEIKGDLYAVSLPQIFGTVKVNVLEWIRGITPNLLHALTPTELNQIGKHVFEHYESYSAISILPKECTPDLKIAVDQLMSQKPQYGLSRWASLQAVEKSLKAYIKAKGGIPPSGGKNAHNLSALSIMAEAAGLPAVDKTAINNAQCGAGIRYNDASTQADAYAAYCASIKICRHIACSFPI